MPHNSRQKHKTKKSETEAESTSRMKTRPRNATIHPGNIVLESGHSRHSKEEVQQEKDRKKAQKQAEERKKIQAEAWSEAGKAFVAQLEAEEAGAAAAAKKDILHRRSATQSTVDHSYQTVMRVRWGYAWNNTHKDRSEILHRIEWL
jgi:hypothetical protein